MDEQKRAMGFVFIPASEQETYAQLWDRIKDVQRVGTGSCRTEDQSAFCIYFRQSADVENLVQKAGVAVLDRTAAQQITDLSKINYI